MNNTDLENRLRERIKEAYLAHLAHDEDMVEPFSLLLEVARIGAEIEREECALVADSYLNHMGDHSALAGVIASVIRARGGK